MGKTGKWLRSFLAGKKDKDHKDKEKCPTTTTTSNQNCSPATTHDQNPTTPISTPKEKRRWSFRRSSATSPASKDSSVVEAPTTPPPVHTTLDFSDNFEQKKHALAVAAATAAVADATAAAAQAAAAVMRLTAASNGKAAAIEEAAAIKIQSVFRSYLVWNMKVQSIFLTIWKKSCIQCFFYMICRLNCYVGFGAGKKSIMCIERTSKVAGIGKGSPGEETGKSHAALHAGIGDSTGSSSSSED